MTTIIITAIVVAALLTAAVIHHQRMLRRRAELMREAVRNRDFTFRLPTKGLLPGEKALQECLNDIGTEVQKLVARSEVESWQRLTRVLTHEIMNAVAPISSISQAYLHSPQIGGSPFEEGLRTIADTSAQMATFVANYRKLTLLQRPVKEPVRLAEYVAKAGAAYSDVRVSSSVEPTLTVTTDPSLLYQVLTNIIKNAVEAGATHVDIRWNGSLLISNDGMPMAPAVRKDIFVPFFTTKQTGTGIGLSLSRQIMTMLGGDLQMADTPVAGHTVTFIIIM